MSTNETVVSAAKAAVETTSSHAAAAQARLEELRQMCALIPRFTIPESGEQTRRLSIAASVPPEFVELTAVAVANEKAVTRGDGRSSAEVRDLMSYATAYSPLADELEAMAQYVRHSVTAARHEAGSEALMTYALAQRVAKRPGGSRLAAAVADMRRALNRARKLTPEALARREAKKAASQATTQSQTATAAQPAQPHAPETPKAS